MSVILSTADLRYITGREARAVHQASTRYICGVFDNYGDNVAVIQHPSLTNSVQVQSGLVSVSGALVEITDNETITFSLNGVWEVIVRVDLTNGLDPQVTLTATQDPLVQQNLTVSPNGIYEYSLATVTVVNGSVQTPVVDNRKILKIDSYTAEDIDKLFYNSTISDKRYERGISLNKDYINSDFSGLNMTQILDKVLTDNLDGYGASTIVATGGPAIITNLFDAVNELLLEFYGKSISGDFGLRLEMPGSKRNGGQLLTISENGNGNVYELVYDNYGPNFLNVNADAFKLPTQYVGQLIQKDKWDSMQKREVVMYNGRSFIEDGQSITLHKGDYLTMSSFEKVTLLFERFDTDAFEQLGYGFKQVHQQNFTIGEDGFYNTNAELFPLSFAVDNPDVVTKAWNISASGILSGKSLNSALNRGYVLVAVIGTVTEGAFNGTLTSALNVSSYNIIQAKQLDPSVQEVIMYDGKNAYDIYNLEESEVTTLKREIGVE